MKSVFSTRDIKLAAILCTLGFEFESPTAPASRIRRESGEESTVFHFLSTSPTGQIADEVMRDYSKGDEYIAANPEAPLSYMLAALRNRDTLVGVIKNTPRQIVFERNGKIISISEDATEADRKRFAKFI
jgi:hypothetical protein